jgi:hypothetical protein
MLSQKEKEFVDYWKARREKEGRFTWQLMTGIPIGLLFSMPIFIIVFTSRFWYKRADMVAVSKLSPVVLVVAVMLIACFIAVFHRRVQWDKKEQQYLELQHREQQEPAR